MTNVLCWKASGHAWQDRDIGTLGKFARGVFAAEHAHGGGRGAQECDSSFLARLHKLRVLTQEAIAWVHCLAPADTFVALLCLSDPNYHISKHLDQE